MNQKLPKPMLEALAREARPANHPSADVLAAFVEHTLLEGEKQAVTDHLARCVECREVVFLASGAAEEAVSEREEAAAAASPVKPRWKWVPRLAWALPLAAAFLLVGGYFVRQRLATAPAGQELASEKVAGAPIRPPEESAKVESIQSLPTVAAPVAVAKSRPTAAPAMAPAAKKAQPVGADVVAMRAAAPAPAESKDLQAKAEKPTPAQEAPATAIGGALVTAAPAAPKANGFVPSPRDALDAYSPAVPGGVSAERSALAALQQVLHPGWRVTAQGHLERRTSEGWTRVLADRATTFRTVTVMGDDVWAGGSGGAVFHSADGGQQWKKLSVAADGAAETAAIVSLRFDDSQQGVATTENGATYVTSDGGASWTKK